MKMTFESSGISSLARFVGDLPEKASANAARALNKGAERARAEAARQINDQLNFPSGYLKPAGGRLVVQRVASPSNLESSVFARGRATSLARFVTSGAVGSKGGVMIQVKKGHSVRAPRAFLIRLRQGVVLDEDNYNIGLAIRLKAGESIRNKKSFVMMKNGLALLYGPSVAQAFGQNLQNTDLTRDISDFVSDELLRLMGVDFHG